MSDCKTCGQPRHRYHKVVLGWIAHNILMLLPRRAFIASATQARWLWRYQGIYATDARFCAHIKETNANG